MNADAPKRFLLPPLFFLTLLAFLTTTCKFSTGENIGIFDQSTDVGNPVLTGTATYDPVTSQYTLTGAGENMWFDKDEFHFLSRKIDGDFILRASVKFIGEGVNAHRKLGIMVRDSLSGGSAHINSAVHGDGLTSLQYRTKSGNHTEEVRSNDVGPDFIQLERQGDNFIFSSSGISNTLTSIEVDGLKLARDANVGIFVCSHETSVLETAVFSDLKLIITDDR